MILRPCPFCSKSIPRAMTVCPYCHKNEQGQSVAMDPLAAQETAAETVSEKDLSDLSSDDPYTRDQAVMRLAKQGVGLVPPLIRLLADPSARGLVGIAKTLGRLRDPRAIRPLSDAAQRGDESLRTSAVWALGQFKNDEALSALLLEAVRPPVALQSFAAFILGGFQDAKAIDVLSKLASHIDREVAFQAVYALGEIRDPKAVPPLRKAFKRSDPLIQSAAQDALRRLNVSAPIKKKSWGWMAGSAAVAIVIAVLVFVFYK